MIVPFKLYIRSYLYILGIFVCVLLIYSKFYYLVRVLNIFVTIYYYGARNYFITIVMILMKFDNYFRALIMTENATNPWFQMPNKLILHNKTR